MCHSGLLEDSNSWHVCSFVPGSAWALAALAEGLFELFMPLQAWIWDKTRMIRKLLCCNQGKLDITDDVLGERTWTYKHEMIFYGKYLPEQVLQLH